MSKESYFPVNGTPPGGSWNLEGWYSNTATSLLDQFRQSSNTKLQHSIVNRLQAIEVCQRSDYHYDHPGTVVHVEHPALQGFPTARNTTHTAPATRILTTSRF